MKTMELRAGKRTRIVKNFSNSIPMTYCFSAENMKDGKEVLGKVDVRGSKWLFPRPPQVLDLKKQNRVAKKAWDSFFSIYVTPESDIRITFKRTKLNLLKLITAPLIIIVAAGSILFWLS